VAESNGRIMHPLAQWESISTPVSGTTDPAQLTDVQAPTVGAPEPECLQGLCEVLADHTADPSHCWFALWEGHGGLRPSAAVRFFSHGEQEPTPQQAPQEWQLDLSAPKFSLPNRDYYLFTGALQDSLKIGDWPTDDWFLPQPPNLFWPDDRSWCVASEIDFDSTLVGGTQQLISDILDRKDLETWPVGPDDSLAQDGDTINEP
jgi:hypothetical protein